MSDESGRVQARGVLGEHYEAINTHLSETFDVVPFAYDWRRSTIKTSQSRLARALADLLAESDQPVRILAHGAGGLLVRQLAARWCAHGCRQGLVGVRDSAKAAASCCWERRMPGTYDAVELLLGIHPVAQQLAMLDPRLGHARCDRDRAILARHPRTAAAGRKVELLQRRRHGARSAAPGTAPSVSGRQRFWPARRPASAALDGEPLPGVEIVCRRRWVWRRAPSTASSRGAREVVLEVTTEGDGRVTHESARLPNVDGLVHRGLTRRPRRPTERGFAAITELLSDGATRAAFQQSAEYRAVAAMRNGARSPSRVFYPIAGDLLTGVFDRTPPGKVFS